MEKRELLYSISFDCADEFIIVPKEMIQEYLQSKGTEEIAYLTKEEILPGQYMEYLERVLNANRHLPGFSYKYIRESQIKEKKIMRILLRQLRKMKVNGVYCFEKVKPCYYKGSIRKYKVKFSAGFIAVRGCMP